MHQIETILFILHESAEDFMRSKMVLTSSLGMKYEPSLYA